MFDLNEKITKWSSNLAQSETLVGSDIDELESHLREEIDQLITLKLTDEEAFLIATHRLGSTDSLAAEYEKINRGVKFRNRLFWMAAGILGYFFITCLAESFSIVLAFKGSSIDYYPGLAFIVLKLMFWSIIIFLCYQLYKGGFDNLKIRHLFSSFKNKFIFFTVLFMTVILLYSIFFFIITDIDSQYEMTKWIMGHRDFEIIEVVWTYLRLVGSVMLPAVLVILLIKLRKSDLQKVDMS